MEGAPEQPESLESRVKKLEVALAEKEKENAELRAENERLKEESRTDELTGLPNRRAFDERAKELASFAQHNKQPLVVARLDLDNFKPVNDVYTHHAGDLFLQKLGQEVQKHLRDSDIFARVGGDEFALLLPNTDEKNAQAVIKRLQEAAIPNAWTATQAEIDTKGKEDVSVSGSFGIATYAPDQDSDISETLKKADQAVFVIKAGGRGDILSAKEIDAYDPSGEAMKTYKNERGD